jgi:hypothetical protein
MIAKLLGGAGGLDRRWLIFLGLAPLAAAAGLWIESRAHTGAAADVSLTRGQAIATAREYLHSLGFETSGWREYCVADVNEPRYLYLKHRQTPEAALARRIAPWGAAVITFRAPGANAWGRVRLSLDGRVLGYAYKPPPGQTEEATEQESLAVATAALASDPVLANALRFTKPEVSSRGPSTDPRRLHIWHSTVAGRSDIDFQVTVATRGKRVLGREVEGIVAAGVVRSIKRESGVFGAEIVVFAYGLFIVGMALYAFYRYVRRSLEKELSHQRALLVALLTALVFAFQLFNVRDSFISASNLGADITTDLIVFLFVLLAAVTVIGGMLVGIAYGAGEGDVREDNPGKLTSLDALILGKLGSRNVGAAILAGAAVAGWLHLLRAGLMAAAGFPAFEEMKQIQVLFFHSPLLAFISGQPLTAIMAVVAGLFQPLAFARLNIRRPALRITFLAACATLASLITGGSASVWAMLLSMAVGAAALLIPFFLFDVLASAASVVTLHSLSLLAFMASLPGEWRQSVVGLGVAGLITVVFLVWAAWRGRTWREEEVRPFYAKQIAERMALEAEVSAARLAQLRLLPQAMPKMEGLTIAASCVPAREVGGDFFDFFQLTPHQLGIFVAEGQAEGLASALSIGLAKGYLMHAVTATHSPLDVLLRLERALGNLLHTKWGASVAFAVVDTAAGRLRYARTGDYPRVSVVFGGKTVAPRLEAVYNPPGRSTPVVEGEVDLEPGYSLFLYTDGVVKRLARIGRLDHSEYLAQLDKDRRRPAEALHADLFASLLPKGRRSGEELEDDLTAVVIRLARREPASKEVVA